MQIWDKNNIAYFPTITSIMPPCIADCNDKRYMVFTGEFGSWFLIDDTVTLEMAMSRFIRYTIPESQILAEAGQKWEFTGKKGKQYTVIFKYGKFSCDCVGFEFWRKCKHIEQAKITISN